MKTSALLAALTLTAAAGVAQAAYDNTTAPHRDRPAATQKADAKAEKTASGETFTDKTRHAFHTMGQKIRNAGHKIAASMHKDKTDDTTHHTAKNDKMDSRSDTHAMGAPAGDNSRK